MSQDAATATNPYRKPFPIGEALRRIMRPVAYDAGKEQPRGQPGNAGQFASGGGGGKITSSNSIKEIQKTPEQHAEAAEMPRSASSTHEAADVLRNAGAVNKELENKELGITGNISGQSLQKMVSGEATQKSVSPAAHAHAIANADKLFERASIQEKYADKEKNPAIKNMHRLGAVMEHKGEIYPVNITVKEYTDKNYPNKIYSIEAVDVERAKKETPWTMTGHSVSASGTSASAPEPSFNDRLIKIAGAVKGARGKKAHANDAHRRNNLALDASTVRRFDENGFLHVSPSHISKECVSPYYGREIPGWEKLGLDPDEVYYGYRSGEELAKGASTFNGLPLLRNHHPESASNPQKEYRVGSLGTDAAFTAPYLDNSLTVTDAEAIRDIESGLARELSAAYQYDPVLTSGSFEGQAYDFIMTNIRGNHVALVEEGRAGPDVLVADAQIHPNPLRKNTMTFEELIAKLKALLASAVGAGGENDTAAGDADDPQPPAKEDEAPDKGAELFALIDAIEDKELAAKIKAKIEEAAAASESSPAADSDEPNGKPDADPGKAEDQDPDEGKKTAEDSDEADKEDKKDMATDAALRRLAMDVKAVREQAKVEAQKHFRGLYDAARKVRPLVGEIDAMAFDSAAGIYLFALRESGGSIKTKDAAALSEMVDITLAAKRTAFPAGMTAPMELDGHFAGLSRIKLQH